MPSAKEIESTEKLLRLIRKDDHSSAEDISPVQEQPPPSKSPPATTSPSPSSRPKLTGGKSPCLAVHLGEDELRIASLSRHRGQPVFEDLRIFPYPPNVGKESPELSTFLASCIKKTTGRSKTNVWTFITTDTVEYASLKLPDVSPRDLHNSVLWAVKKEKKFNESNHLFEYRILDRVMDKGVAKRLAVYFLIPREEIKRLKALFRQAGHPLSGISIEPLAIQNYFSSRWVQDVESVHAHVHLGLQSSRIDIFDQNRLLFSRTVRTGASSFIEAAQEDLNGGGIEHPQLLEDSPPSAVSKPLDARTLFFSHIGPAGPRAVVSDAPSAERILEMFQPALDRLTQQVERTLEFTVNNLGFQAVDKLLLSGSPALFPGVKESMAGQLAVPVILFDPLVSGSDSLSPLGAIPPGIRDRMELLHVAGLALSSNELTMNALYTHAQRAREKKESLMVKVAGLFCVLLLAAVFGAFTHVSATLGQLTADIRAEETRLQSLAEYPDTRGIESLFADVRNRDAAIKGYLARYKPMGTMSVLSSVTPIWAELESVDLRFPTGEGDPPRTVVSGLISGQVETLDARLGSYIMLLGNSDAFTDPRMVRKGKVDRGGETRLEFQVDLKLR